MIARIAVVIPAADEEDEIAGCLASVQVARAYLHRTFAGAARSSVVVVLDDCRDATADEVARFPGVEVVSCALRSVGGARRVGAAHALAAFGPDRELWLASTDADCRVPATWLTGMREEAERGAQLVLGTVRPASGLPSAVERAWYAAHHIGNDHPHVHGANLGIAAATYRRIGGWRDLAADEDVDLVARAGPARIHRIGTNPVITSNRRHGRTPHGYAGFLRGLEDAG